MNFYDVIAARHMVRDFSEKPVPPEALERVLPCYIGLGWPAPEDKRPEQVPAVLQDKLHKGTW